MNFKEKLAQLVEDIKQEYLSVEQSYPWIIGFSGGKDSTLVVHAVFQALLDISPSKLKRRIHVVSNDTLVDSPLVVSHMRESLDEIDIAAKTLNLPLQVAVTRPELKNTFWVLLIGKGYPSPNAQMRWCTDRLKILPTSTYVRTQVQENGSAIILLGVRRDESDSRKRSIDAHQDMAGTRLHQHKQLIGAFVYRPIVDFTTDDVWEILAFCSPPWGGSHRRLIKLYREASGGECPLVFSSEEAPGCGTNSSRFGCWTCTVVEKDKSLQGFVDSGNRQYFPLIEFRDWLKEIRNDFSLRQGKRRSGKVTILKGKLVPGPFTMETRKKILEKLLETQEQYGETLISESEIDLIQKIWASDLIAMADDRGTKYVNK